MVVVLTLPWPWEQCDSAVLHEPCILVDASLIPPYIPSIHPSSCPIESFSSTIFFQKLLHHTASPLDPLPHIIRRRLSLAIPQILHLIRRHQTSLHATVQVAFAQLATLGRVDSAGSFEAAQVLFHQRLAFGVVVEWERAFGGRVGAADFDAGAGGAEGRHFFGGYLSGLFD